MRIISIESSPGEIVPFYFFTVLYFIFANSIRSWTFNFMGAITLTVGSIFFFSILPAPDSFEARLRRLLYTWSYTLFPTILWFYSTLIFYILLPPPRTSSLLGQAFSIFYIAYSGSLLIWKILLVYFSIRFSLRVHVYRIVYYLLLYLAFSIPVWIALYNMGVSRIPFV